ncbi:histidine kinase, partial [bacterium]|nr:histidine kinase [bacterium]
MLDLDSYLLPTPHDRATAFHELMRHRVHDILVVSSLYDSFLLAQDGQLHEQMFSEFAELNLQQAPQVTRASHARRALEIAVADPRINLVITTPHVGDMDVLEFGEKLREMYPQLAVVLLAFDHRELKELLKLRESPAFDKVFLWQGDFRILLAITKYFEDVWNVEHDTRIGDVQVILLIEDSVRFYSSYLPMFYAEVMRHSQNLISESVNLYHKILRMRARPKILHCETFEDAWGKYRKYEKYVLGIVSDIEFPLAGKVHPEAGVKFIEQVKERRSDIPVLLQSSKPETAALAEALGIRFALKGSPQLLGDLRRFMTESLGFGDFVFRLDDGTELERASDMRELELKLHTVREESIRYHAERDHFSNWLKARTEFELADRLKPRKVSDYPNLEALRRDLIESIQSWRHERTHGHVADFSHETFEPSSEFVRIGAGSLGGKARGLAFASHVLNHCPLGEKYPTVNISVPPCLVLCTDVFDEFIELNSLREFALHCDDDKEIERRFLRAELAERIRSDLYAYLKAVRYPLAVRSSSLLEDSQFHP